LQACGTGSNVNVRLIAGLLQVLVAKKSNVNCGNFAVQVCCGSGSLSGVQEKFSTIDDI
jgi:hypothetical protein